MAIGLAYKRRVEVAPWFLECAQVVFLYFLVFGEFRLL